MKLLIKSFKIARKQNLESLLRRKKLHLVLDLDNTLLHSKRRKLLTSVESDYIDAKKSSSLHENNKQDEVHELKDGVHVTKLRPGVREFLREASTMFDLSIYTMGTQHYAKTLAEILDECGEFGGRFRTSPISREYCMITQRKALDAVNVDERFVLIVDDKKDVWRDCDKGNVIHIEPYTFFSTMDKPCFESERGEDGRMDDGLAKVLRILRLVYNGFYGDGDDDCSAKDVRRLLESVRADEKQDGDEEKAMPMLHRSIEEGRLFEASVGVENVKKRSRTNVWNSLKKFKGCQDQIGLIRVATV